jgi:lipopolysaccharide export system protein LptA
VQGEKVVVFLDEGRAVVEGGDSGPVRAYIEPDSKSLDGLLGKEK